MNNCNCGICDLINDCINEGNWETCKVNNTMGQVEALYQVNEKLSYKLSKIRAVVKVWEHAGYMNGNEAIIDIKDVLERE